MCCSKGLLAAFTMGMAATGWGGDAAIEEILGTSKTIVNEAERQAGEVSEELRSVNPSEIEDREWLKGKPRKPLDYEEQAGETEQARGWDQIMSAVDEGSKTLANGPARPPIPEDVLYVYISLAMPEQTVRELFLQALQTDLDRTTIFLLRGWEPPGLGNLVARLNTLFPEAEKLGELPNVQINPTLFEQQGITLVPTFSTKDKAGVWGTVVGETSLRDAVRRIEDKRYEGQVIGPTFEIEEPNILALIRKRIAETDWQAQVARVKQDLLTKRRSGQPLPVAREDDTYLVDLTIVNNQPLRGANGEVFAPAGVSVNPFDYLTTRKRYVFFDANDEAQVEQAVRWKEKNDYTTFITTVPVRTVEGRKSTIKRLGQPVYEINEMLIDRFKLRAVPALAYQEGKMLRVDIAGVKRSGIQGPVERKGQNP